MPDILPERSPSGGNLARDNLKINIQCVGSAAQHGLYQLALLVRMQGPLIGGILMNHTACSADHHCFIVQPYPDNFGEAGRLRVVWRKGLLGARLDVCEEACIPDHVARRGIVAHDVPVGVAVAAAGGGGAAHAGRGAPDELREVPDGIKVGLVAREGRGREGVVLDLAVPGSDGVADSGRCATGCGVPCHVRILARGAVAEGAGAAQLVDAGVGLGLQCRIVCQRGCTVQAAVVVGEAQAVVGAVRGAAAKT